MTRILTGIGQLIGTLWDVEPKEAGESLEEKINNAIAGEREKIKPSKEDIEIFSWVTGDNNPIHRIQKRARKMGFDDIPLMGAHIAAYGEQFILGVVEHMRKYWGADIKIIGQENRFQNALYPNERTLWQVSGYKKKDEEIELEVIGRVKDREIIAITSRLGKTTHLMPQIAGPIYSERYLVEKEHLDEFYNSVGGTNEGRFPNMLTAAFVPSTLLELLKRKTQTVEGKNVIMNFLFLNEAKPGKIQVDIFPTTKPEPRERKDEKGNLITDKNTNEPIIDYMYRFRTVVSQDTKPITYGRIVSTAPYEIDLSI